MSEKVVGLRGQPVPAAGEADPGVVAFLEGILAEAKAGQISAIAVADVQTNGCICYGWAFSAGGDFKIGAALFRLQHAYAKYLFERGA